jgi:hypothetical protein
MLAFWFAVFAPRDVTDSLVHRICEEASAIWESAGIAFACHRVGSEVEAGDWPLENARFVHLDIGSETRICRLAVGL